MSWILWHILNSSLSCGQPRFPYSKEFKEWTMNHYFGTSGHSLVNFVFLRNIWIVCVCCVRVCVCVLNKVLIFKKRTQKLESPWRQICVFIRPNVYQEDKLCTVSKEILFTSDEISLLSCKKKITLLKYIIQNSFMCNMLNSK